MLKKLYEKSNLWFAIAWIVVYCVLMSAADLLSVRIGVEKSVSLPVGLLLTVVLLAFLKKNDLTVPLGLCRPRVSARAVLYYVPALILLTANLWYGVAWNYGVAETALYVLTMLCVGCLEEIIFRGLLFHAMRKDSVRAAVIVSSVTFGMGHIVNLFNGSGAELIQNLLQVIYATAAGFMFVMLCCKTKSLVPCILIHGVFNAMSAFENESGAAEHRLLSCVLLTVITGSYAVYMALTMRGKGGEATP